MKRKKSPHIVGVANNPAEDPIKRNRIPGWFARCVKAARARGHKIEPGVRGPWTGFEAFQGALRYDSRFNTIFDHIGKDPDGFLFTEPYRREDDPKVLEAITAFTDVFNLEWEFVPSCWNPPSTIAIRFWPKDISLLPWPNRRRTR